MISSCSILIRKGPAQEPAVLGVRAAWAMFGSGGIDVKIILMADGIYSVLGRNDYLATMYARFIGEVGKVYAVEEDMNARGIKPASLPEGIVVTPAAGVAALIDDADSVMTF